ncbi:hypothetical protein F441_06010 [Phytophthora nicotianae CJ01A1]|uniref:Uncharacterized protein n=3 Tax=Phytophthora nicotianae TaxID=4792 RepID=W2XCY0_PHYNI|nr:hypothetical protein L916_05694 [Phytophthora nicotianae]ETO79202.1 hypothetical protein F444_06049 [Phytophthora nicotianae P1976]ETP20238.1 hypothetical protein F441_06010 [Phytophthora nicotianae CJ01A1]
MATLVLIADCTQTPSKQAVNQKGVSGSKKLSAMSEFGTMSSQ